MVLTHRGGMVPVRMSKLGNSCTMGFGIRPTRWGAAGGGGVELSERLQL